MDTQVHTLPDRTRVVTGDQETVFKGHNSEAAVQIGLLHQCLLDRRFAPMGDNHHNAALCPHCGEPLRKALARVAELEAKMRGLKHKHTAANNVLATYQCARCGSSATAEIAIGFSRSVWRFPESRFVEYEESDEEWARPLGFGHEEIVEGVLTFPRVVFTDIDDNRAVFLALPEEPPDSLSGSGGGR